jgi:hypothetical protein
VAQDRSGIAVASTEGSAGPRWNKSSWSAANGHCVEVAQLGDHVGVRHSLDTAPGRPVLVFTREEWETFLLGIGASDFDPA